MDIDLRSAVCIACLLLPAYAQNAVEIDTAQAEDTAAVLPDTAACSTVRHTASEQLPVSAVPAVRTDDYEIVVTVDRDHGQDPSAKPVVVSGKKVRETSRSK